MDWHKSHSTTSFYDGTTTYVHLYILKERVGMNWHELYTRTILIISPLFSEMTIVSIRITWTSRNAFLALRFLTCL